MSGTNIVLAIWLLGCMFVTICFAKWRHEDNDLVLFAKLFPEIFALTAIVAVITWPLGLIWLIIEDH